MNAPPLHPLLDGIPSHTTRKARCLHKLHEEVNLLLQLMDRLKACERLRECEQWSQDPYQPDSHLRAIEREEYRRAYQLITAHGVSV
jgi:hypothetical protein